MTGLIQWNDFTFVPEITMNFKFYLACGIVAILMSCHETNTQNTKAVREEMRSREIVHVTPIQIVERANQMGDSLVIKAEQIIQNACREKLDSSLEVGFRKAEIDLNLHYGCRVRGISLKKMGKELAKSKTEAEVLDAYLYNQENNLPLEPNLQKEGDSVLIFSKALRVSNDCFQKTSVLGWQGDPGDTVGIWMVRLPKKKVILSFTRY